MYRDAPGITTKSERKKFRAEQAQIFEEKYKGDSTVLDNLQKPPPEHGKFELPEVVVDHKRALEHQRLQQAQKNAALSADHMSLEARRRRTVFAEDQLAAIMLQAKAESGMSNASSSATIAEDYDSDTDTLKSVTGSTVSIN